MLVTLVESERNSLVEETRSMNLNKSPTRQQLESLLRSADDSKAHHVIWVSKAGDVAVTPLPKGVGPVELEKNTPQMAIRYETCQCGNGYVGLKAARDTNYVSRMFNSLVKEWQGASTADSVIYVDVF